MSEVINNREYRQKILKELIMELHNGKSAEEVKERFAKLIEGICTFRDLGDGAGSYHGRNASFRGSEAL